MAQLAEPKPLILMCTRTTIIYSGGWKVSTDYMVSRKDYFFTRNGIFVEVAQFLRTLSRISF